MTLDSYLLFGSPDARDALRAEAESYLVRAVSMMNRARALVLDNRVQAIDLLNARRTALCDHLRRYQRFKHGSIFDPVVRHGPASSRVVAATMKLDCMELGEIFQAYHLRWRTLRAADWASFRTDMVETADMMIHHMEAELRAIRQLLMISGLYSGQPSREANPVAAVTG